MYLGMLFTLEDGRGCWTPKWHAEQTPPLRLCGVHYLSDPVRLVLYPYHPPLTVSHIISFIYCYMYAVFEVTSHLIRSLARAS